MKNFLIAIIPGCLLFSGCVQQTDNNKAKMTYPETRMTDTVDNYFGEAVPDPYRWLEDDNSAETTQWVTEQNKVTDTWMEKVPYRNDLKERLTGLWNYERYGVPFHKGNFYYFFKNDGIQNQSVLYIQDSLDGEARVFLDPNKLAEDGTTSLSEYKVSHNGKYFAYAISKAGSDWNEIYVMETATGKQLTDQLEWVKFSTIAWRGDGFYYSRYDKPSGGSELSVKNEFQKVYYHKVGNPQSADELIYENPNYPLRNYGALTTLDEQFVILVENESTSGNALYVKDLKTPARGFVKLVDGFRYDYTVVHNNSHKFMLLTNSGAERYQLVEVDATNPAPANWKTIIPETENVLSSVEVAGGKLVAQYMVDAHSEMKVFDMDGKLLQTLSLPGPGTIAGFNGNEDEDLAFYSFTSFLEPSTVFTYDLKTNTSEVLYKSALDFDASLYISEQVFYTSKDGTRIPMFIVHRKDIKKDGTNPVYLYGYGGFNISLTPSFSVSRLLFLEQGGVVAIANLRGGGEYGDAWHRAGTKLQKQNVFDDFIAAAEYLIENKYTKPEKIAIAGGSNGGLLVGACMTQRPDLFGVALPAVGVMDMLRFHKFTIGWAWTDDYGSSEDSVQYRYLKAYSPLHNLKEGSCYPATLITTADHDDRVVPAHSFKFAAALQKAQSCNNPTLIRIETNAGHGAGKPVSKLIEEATDIWSFTMYNLGMNPTFK
ncbi:MAG: prolyl oligopeptidase family serine peptidase [Lentimicrobium sp.]|jgi:prolyl oligopeptidase|nr:prolyl oligopeptidase family serine peptidase [Lentimicrobium sp.]MDD2527159.1 prolyl oligopeptidase family serine peptidase [Lentimicrobiaceae bacterium]MDD4599299.1 prolyl oligopeptidase family serine peptidase [Lentimicrobiaceae bacterium]MDY0025739.1 prolyl oligopeptidase family serine peptidase [Lentimicrobium sp.]HAH57272.1 S9 family peptidase [Bacteroidales bacterium]